MLVAQSCLTLCNPQTIGRQAPLSLEFSRQEYWSEVLFPPLEYLPNPGIELMSRVSPALAGRFFTTEPPGNKSNYGHVEFECLWDLQGEDIQQTVVLFTALQNFPHPTSGSSSAEDTEIHVHFLGWGNVSLIEGPVATERCMWREWVRRYVFNEKGFQRAWQKGLRGDGC